VRVADYVMTFLVRHGVQDIFLVSGGGIMHLMDAAGQADGMNYWCNYHEQACGVSAEGYARVTGKPGACLATVGPGASNLVSGIIGAWVDSIPLLAIVGQVRRDLVADYARVRQRGPQEGNTIALASPVTKLALTVSDPKMIRHDLEHAWHVATSGRPGPVLIEIPLDIQGSLVEEAELCGFVPSVPMSSAGRLAAEVRQVVEVLRAAKRPLLLGGSGVRLGHAEALFNEVVDKLRIPVVLPDAAKDLLPEDHPGNLGIFGTAGQRRANFAVQNSDCLLSLGAGLCVKKVGFNYKGFAPKACKIVVDIDEGQLLHQAVQPHIPVLADVREFLQLLARELDDHPIDPQPRWLAACAIWKARYPLIVPDYFDDKDHVNSYVFVDRLSDALDPSDVIVGGSGLDTVSCIQALKIKQGQRSFTSINWGSMGWDLPMAVGACIGHDRRRTVCVTGDGSVQLNLQELMTIRQYQLPIKLFVFNNQGYASIRSTQQAFFEGRLVGSHPASGVTSPDFSKLAAAYGLPFLRIENNDAVDATVREVLALEGPVLCEVNISPEQGITPKASSFRRADGTFESRPLEDMAPFLPREEIAGNMSLFDDEGP